MQKMEQFPILNQIGLSELEICRPHGLGKIYNYLIRKKISIILSLWNESLRDRWVIDVCCGSGMDLEYLSLVGANTLGVDISHRALLGAQERARRYGLDFNLLAADAENLPLIDEVFKSLSFMTVCTILEIPRRGSWKWPELPGKVS